MSVYVTNAPAVYDYESMVVSSRPITARLSSRLGASRASDNAFRIVVLDDREDGYYREYQIGRYRSGAYLVMTLEQYQKEVELGYIEEEEHESD